MGNPGSSKHSDRERSGNARPPPVSNVQSALPGRAVVLARPVIRGPATRGAIGSSGCSDRFCGFGGAASRNASRSRTSCSGNASSSIVGMAEPDQG